ncbi:MAG TPA: DUF4199 domain-containing protein [Opitutaceae bacterium]
MKHYALYGFISALAGAFLILILYFLGFQSDAAHMGISNWVGGLLGFVIGITCIVLGVKARREDVPLTEEFGFGKSFKAAFMVSIFSTIFGDIFNTVYLGFINPAINDSRLQERLAALENSGMAGDKLDHAESMTRTMFGLGPQAAIYLIIGAIIGVILSLIVAGFLTRPATLPPKV